VYGRAFNNQNDWLVGQTKCFSQVRSGWLKNASLEIMNIVIRETHLMVTSFPATVAKIGIHDSDLT